MKPLFTAALAVVLLCNCSYANDLLKKPLLIFSEKYAEIGPQFERAKIETTWGGFFLRADTQHFFRESEWKPSSSGIWIGVRTLPVQDLESASQTQPTNDYIEKVEAIKFPKQKDGTDSGLLITLRYGAQCDPKVVAELVKAIDVLKKEAQQNAQPPPSRIASLFHGGLPSYPPAQGLNT